MMHSTPMRFEELPKEHYRVILADPPWRYACQAPPEKPRPIVLAGGRTIHPEYYYTTMPLDDLKRLPVRECGAVNSCLFLWATVPLLQDALQVMAAWGYTYKTMLTWIKTNGPRLGYWFRGQTEHVLVGIKGHVKAFRCQQSNIIENKRGRHSAKPERLYELIESISPGPYLELFARRARGGWTACGNEVEYDLLSDTELTPALAQVVPDEGRNGP